MNEKLTSEQREWIHDEAWANFEYAEIDGQTRNVITLTQLDVILDTAHPAEAEDELEKYPTKWAYEQLVKHHQEHHQKIEPKIALQKFREWVNSVPYDVSELMELIAIDILKDYKDWLQQGG